MGTLRFKILKIFPLVFCLLNCNDVSVVVFMSILFVDNLPVFPLSGITRKAGMTRGSRIH